MPGAHRLLSNERPTCLLAAAAAAGTHSVSAAADKTPAAVTRALNKRHNLVRRHSDRSGAAAQCVAETCHARYSTTSVGFVDVLPVHITSRYLRISDVIGDVIMSSVRGSVQVLAVRLMLVLQACQLAVRGEYYPP